MNKFRTLIRVDRYDETNFYVVLPGWDVYQDIPLSKDLIPEYARMVIESEIDKNNVYRFHVLCNLNAQNPQELSFEAFEID